MMTQEIFKETESMKGMVPGSFKAADSTLQPDPVVVPNEYRELMAAAIRCRNCAFFHTEITRLNGAA